MGSWFHVSEWKSLKGEVAELCGMLSVINWMVLTSTGGRRMPLLCILINHGRFC